MKREKLGIVEALKIKHRASLARANKILEARQVGSQPPAGSIPFSSDIFLFQKWAYRVGKGWYGFDLGDIPRAWADVLDDFLAWMESQCPDFEIRQIKIKFGGLRFYIDTKCPREAINTMVQSEIAQLQDLLKHDHHQH